MGNLIEDKTALCKSIGKAVVDTSSNKENVALAKGLIALSDCVLALGKDQIRIVKALNENTDDLEKLGERTDKMKIIIEKIGKRLAEIK